MNYEYCELWWSDGYRPQLTFYKPLSAESVHVGQEDASDTLEGWDAVQRAIAELGLNGWELVSAIHHGGGLLFKRQLQ